MASVSRLGKIEVRYPTLIEKPKPTTRAFIDSTFAFDYLRIIQLELTRWILLPSNSTRWIHNNQLINMQNKLSIIAGALLGLLFIVFGLNFFLHFIPIPSPPEGSHAASFMGAAYMTGFLTFVKVLEILGGVLVAIPKTRNLGLLILGADHRQYPGLQLLHCGWWLIATSCCSGYSTGSLPPICRTIRIP